MLRDRADTPEIPGSRLASLLSKALHGAVLIGLLASPAVAVAQGTATRPAETDCAGFEPDPVQISWNSPCDEGSWLCWPVLLLA